DRLIADQPGGAIDRMRVAPLETQISLRADDEVRLCSSEAMQPSEVDVAAIHDVDRSRFRNQLVEQSEIRDEPAGYPKERRNTSSQVEERVQLDRRFRPAKGSP